MPPEDTTNEVQETVLVLVDGGELNEFTGPKRMKEAEDFIAEHESEWGAGQSEYRVFSGYELPVKVTQQAVKVKIGL